jgi:hypothetical protein
LVSFDIIIYNLFIEKSWPSRQLRLSKASFRRFSLALSEGNKVNKVKASFSPANAWLIFSATGEVAIWQLLSRLRSWVASSLTCGDGHTGTRRYGEAACAAFPRHIDT